VKLGRTRVVLNPSAAAGHAAKGIDAVRELLDAAWPAVEWCTSRSREHFVDSCADAAAAGYDRVIVAGGDGSVHLAVRALAHTATCLGIIPLGTGNDFAKAIGIPIEPEAAARALITRVAHPVDLGSVNGVPFCCVAGVGMDTPALKFIASLPFEKRSFIYQIAAARTLLHYPGCDLTIDMDGRSVTERMVFAAFCNTPTYAGGIPISPRASAFDGQLDYCLFRDCPLMQRFATLLRVRSGLHVGRRDVLSGVANAIRVDTVVPVSVTLDGELTSITTPVVIEPMPRALRVIGAMRQSP
jgi:diacylglycerol kinase (ATP)